MVAPLSPPREPLDFKKEKKKNLIPIFGGHYERKCVLNYALVMHIIPNRMARQK